MVMVRVIVGVIVIAIMAIVSRNVRVIVMDIVMAVGIVMAIAALTVTVTSIAQIPAILFLMTRVVVARRRI